MSDSLNLTSGTTSAVYSVSMILEGIFSLISGRLTDRFGPRIVLSSSAMLVAIGYVLMPLVHASWQLFLVYGVLIGTGMGGIFVPVISTIARWFISRRSLLTGAVGSAVGLGTLIFSPLESSLIRHFDWDRTFMIMGIVILVVVLAAAQFMKRDPSVRGQNPDGFSASAHQRRLSQQKTEFSFKQALRTREFWFIFVMILLFGYYSSSVNVHIVPQAENQGISPGTAANILATSGALLIVGRIILGALADRIGNRSIYVLGFSIATVFLLWIFFLKAEWAYFIFAAAMGICQGGNGVAQSPLLASLFGLRSLGAIFGLSGLGFTLGASIGPFVTGRIFDLTRSYQTPIAISIAVSVAALVLALLLRPAVRAPQTVK